MRWLAFPPLLAPLPRRIFAFLWFLSCLSGAFSPFGFCHQEPSTYEAILASARRNAIRDHLNRILYATQDLFSEALARSQREGGPITIDDKKLETILISNGWMDSHGSIVWSSSLSPDQRDPWSHERIQRVLVQQSIMSTLLAETIFEEASSTPFRQVMAYEGRESHGLSGPKTSPLAKLRLLQLLYFQQWMKDRMENIQEISRARSSGPAVGLNFIVGAGGILGFIVLVLSLFPGLMTFGGVAMAFTVALLISLGHVVMHQRHSAADSPETSIPTIKSLVERAAEFRVSGFNNRASELHLPTPVRDWASNVVASPALGSQAAVSSFEEYCQLFLEERPLSAEKTENNALPIAPNGMTQEPASSGEPTYVRVAPSFDSVDSGRQARSTSEGQEPAAGAFPQGKGHQAGQSNGD